MFKIIITFSTIIILFLLTGCTSKVGKEIGKHSFSLENHPIEQAYFKEDNIVKKNFEYGLALSGGGIRSAMFNIGVLKALYDEAIINKIDVISAVSGGGYAAYWLLSSHLINDINDTTGKIAFDSKPFGYNLLETNDNFLKSTCRLHTNGNSVGVNRYTIINLLPILFFQTEPLKNFYRGQLIRTYGNIEDNSLANSGKHNLINTPIGRVTIDKYSKLIKDNNFPYFIFNMTLSIENCDNGWANGLYEFTPLLRGNEGIGYIKIDKNNTLPLSLISTISGAAVKQILHHDVKNPHKDTLEQEEIKLSDGGHSENLGAIALIRRGVKTIIIIDAEEDKEYQFEGYFILKDRLAKWGLTLKNDMLDKFEKVDEKVKEFWHRKNIQNLKENDLKNGEFISKVINKKGDSISTVYYLKMSILGDLRKEFDDEYNVVQELKEKDKVDSNTLYSENAKIRKFLHDHKDSNGHLNCSKLNAVDFDVMKWIKQEAIYRSKGKYSDAFPQVTTWDQSWHNDQVVAYIGLGYEQGQRLVKLLRKNQTKYDQQRKYK